MSGLDQKIPFILFKDNFHKVGILEGGHQTFRSSKTEEDQPWNLKCSREYETCERL